MGLARMVDAQPTPMKTVGVYTRITQRLAMTATIWHNWATAESVKRSLITYDH